jgi:Protein of unknown function (DUF2842)
MLEPGCAPLIVPRSRSASYAKAAIAAMKIRTRKFLGTIALLVLAATWALLGMALAQMPWIAESGWRQAIYYVVVGMGWVLPAMPVVSWMQRPDPA